MKSGDLYRHYKGAVYKIIALARAVSEDGVRGNDISALKQLVVYQDISAPEKIWVRALDKFGESFESDGQMVKRFELIETN